MKHLEISEELHDTIKFYCFVNNLKLKDYVNSKLSNLPEIKDFRKKEFLKNLRT